MCRWGLPAGSTTSHQITLCWTEVPESWGFLGIGEIWLSGDIPEEITGSSSIMCMGSKISTYATWVAQKMDFLSYKIIYLFLLWWEWKKKSFQCIKAKAFCLIWNPFFKNFLLKNGLDFWFFSVEHLIFYIK